MVRLTLPLWLITEEHSQTPPAHTPCDDHGATIAFTTIRRLAAFLKRRQAGKWKVNLIAELHDAMLFIADFMALAQQPFALTLRPMAAVASTCRLESSWTN